MDISPYATTGDQPVQAALDESSDPPAVAYLAGDGSQRSAPIPLSNEERASFAEPAAWGRCTDGCLNLTMTRQWAIVTVILAPLTAVGIGGCGPSGERHRWRVLVAPIDRGGIIGQFRELAVGSSHLSFVPGYARGEGGDCAHPLEVPFAVDGDLIAMAIESPRVGRPTAETIVIRSLEDGSTIRRVATIRRVVSMQLSGSTLVWMEANAASATRLPIGVSTAAHPNATYPMTFEVPGSSRDWDVPSYSLRGDRLAWEGFTTGKIWVRDIVNSATPAQVSPEGVVCHLDGFDGTRIAMECSDEVITMWQYDPHAMWAVVWTPSRGARVLAGLPADYSWVSTELRPSGLYVDVAGGYDADSSDYRYLVPYSAID